MLTAFNFRSLINPFLEPEDRTLIHVDGRLEKDLCFSRDGKLSDGRYVTVSLDDDEKEGRAILRFSISRPDPENFRNDRELCSTWVISQDSAGQVDGEPGDFADFQDALRLLIRNNRN
jgi:hypothetical protein